jgi:hypothetical protein
VANKSTKHSPQALEEADRLRIGHAREVLQEYGLYVDVAEMSDVAYEQRNCRMKALDLAVARRNALSRPHPDSSTVGLAQEFYEFIWAGKGPDGAV